MESNEFRLFKSELPGSGVQGANLLSGKTHSQKRRGHNPIRRRLCEMPGSTILCCNLCLTTPPKVATYQLVKDARATIKPFASMTLTKRDLVMRISSETGLVQQQVLEIVQKTLDYIAEALSKGDKVELRNFGVFEVKVRKPRVGRNPNAPETDVPIPQRAVVKFKAGKEMRADVIKLTPKGATPASPA
jgi:nucleoid DNA-binding protein